MQTTAAPTDTAAQDETRAARFRAHFAPTVGAYVQPDGWQIGNTLTACTWDAAPFRLEAPRVGIALAVRVEVTGRSVQRIPGGAGYGVRVRITFVGDEEPDTTTSGWMAAA